MGRSAGDSASGSGTRLVGEGIDFMATAVRSKSVVACSPDESEDRVLELMQKTRIRHVAITDNPGRVVGVISEADVALRIQDRQRLAEVVGSVCQPDPG